MNEYVVSYVVYSLTGTSYLTVNTEDTKVRNMQKSLVDLKNIGSPSFLSQMFNNP